MKPSRPFPNGSTFEFFNEVFCCRCTKLKLDDDGMPLEDNCEIENAIAEAQFDEKAWPENDIVEVNGHYHVCRHFHSEDESLMYKFREIMGLPQPIQRMEGF